MTGYTHSCDVAMSLPLIFNTNYLCKYDFLFLSLKHNLLEQIKILIVYTMPLVTLYF